jgi:hypothetical protein
MRALLAVAVLSACARSGVEPTTARSDTTSPGRSTGSVCIKPPEIEATITHASADGEQVKFCVGAAADACFAFDLSTRTLARLPEAPRDVVEGARIEATSARIDVCKDGECTPLTPKVLPAAATLHAATNNDGTIAVILLGDAPAGRGHAEVWDVAKKKRIAKFRYARGEFRCGQVALTGDTIYLNATTCRSPSARAALYTRTGRRLANVGGRDFGTYGNAHTLVEGTTWAFLEENGNRVAIQDVARGKLLRTIDISALWTPDGQPDPSAIGNPGESAIVRLDSGKLAVIAGAPGTGKLALVEPDTGEVEIVTAPVCGD